MSKVDYVNFDFGERLNGFIQEVMNYGGAPRTEADLTEGADAAAMIERFFANPEVAYIHAHYARRGCFAALIER